MRGGDNEPRQHESRNHADEGEQAQAQITPHDDVCARQRQRQAELLPVAALVERDDGEGEGEWDEHRKHRSHHVEVLHDDADEPAH